MLSQEGGEAYRRASDEYNALVRYKNALSNSYDEVFEAHKTYYSFYQQNTL